MDNVNDLKAQVAKLKGDKMTVEMRLGELEDREQTYQVVAHIVYSRWTLFNSTCLVIKGPHQAHAIKIATTAGTNDTVQK
jgi:hypothetical protein